MDHSIQEPGDLDNTDGSVDLGTLEQGEDAFAVADEANREKKEKAGEGQKEAEGEKQPEGQDGKEGKEGKGEDEKAEAQGEDGKVKAKEKEKKDRPKRDKRGKPDYEDQDEKGAGVSLLFRPHCVVALSWFHLVLSCLRVPVLFLAC